ncbi:DapH/DapD/GlmU-related protein [Polynucleobacter sp. MWH-Adler-W8]|uniref:DapH/DapD/GlmU-related protein n=1 Tax=Polynucleobacter sp. MWH-Adler-W8 TaxID=1819727 RepID=UPI0009280691|nr:DapH/DapD/GlmU-related protein [Polynucleobacter sp. MWH-Adler-W8]OJI04671.1 acetyltransferase [Polynucleobacter sp. MWH-Adler-W8]
MFSTFQTYGLFGFIRLLGDLLRTKIFYHNARLIRSPNYFRGKPYIYFGKNLTTGIGLRLDAFPEKNSNFLIKFGSNVQINDYVHIGSISCVEIGDDVLIASRVFISDHNHGAFNGNNQFYSPEIAPALRPLTGSPVFIGSRVWIGEGVCILPGVSIGSGSIIGAGAVVTKNIPENSVAVGNPARVIRRFDRTINEWRRV